MVDHNNNPSGRGGFGDHPENINRNGVPRRPEIQKFREALARVESEKGSELLEHAIRLAFDDNKNKDVLIAILRKILPDLGSIDVESFTLADLMSVIRDGKGGQSVNESGSDRPQGPSDCDKV